MQTSVVNYRDLNFELRIDAEYYRAEVLENINLLDRKDNGILSDLASFVIGPFGSTVTVDQYVPSSSFKYVRNKDINDFQISDDDPAYIPEQVYKGLPQFHIRENDLLITVVGTLGKAAIATKKNAFSIFSCKSTIIRAKKIDPFYLLAYLNSSVGQLFALRGARGAIQQGLNLSDLKEIKVFLPSDVFQKSVRSIVVKAFVITDDAKNLYSQAEQILLSELGLLNWKPKHRLSFVRNFSDAKSADRIDAEYFQPMYEEILNRSKGKVKIFRAEEVFTFRRGDFIDTKYYTSEKTKRAYIRIKELSNSDSINGNEVVYLDDAFSDSSQNTLKENDIVMAIIGDTIGKSNLILNEFAGSYFSNNTGRFRLRPEAKDSYNPFFLETLFHSIYIQSQVERAKAQTGQPKIADKEVKNISIPCISLDMQKQIGEYVRNAIENKARSKYLLDIAKRGVELAIEKTEKDAEKWIKAEREKIGV